MLAFSDLLQRIAAYFIENRNEVRSQGQQLQDVMERLKPRAIADDYELNVEPLVNMTLPPYFLTSFFSMIILPVPSLLEFL